MAVEVFPPGEYILDELAEMGWTQARLGRETGLTEKHISQLLRARVRLTLEVARAIEDATGMPAHVLLNIQTQWDLAPPERRVMPDAYSLPWRRRRS